MLKEDISKYKLHVHVEIHSLFNEVAGVFMKKEKKTKWYGNGTLGEIISYKCILKNRHFFL